MSPEIGEHLYSPDVPILERTNFAEFGERREGKVRDIYIQNDTIALVATDRFSAFNRNVTHIPYKGEIVTAISRFWMDQTSHIIRNAAIDYPDPNVTIEQKCGVLPVEVVVRGYISGSTDTSLWVNYEKGQRDFGDFVLPDGLRKNQSLEEIVITPTTKDAHDRPLTGDEVIKTRFVDRRRWQMIADIARHLFLYGRGVAEKKGLILVDTKYEFGLTDSGELVLIDELHTPDSSRYWDINNYNDSFVRGIEPENYDKEYLRLFLKSICDPYQNEVLPEVPRAAIIEQTSRYIDVYERLTGQPFQPDLGLLPKSDRIHQNLISYFGKVA